MKESELKNNSLRNKIKLFYKKNSLLIDAVGFTLLGSLVVYTSIKCDEYSIENDQLKIELELEKATHNLDNSEKNERISELTELIELKDKAHLELASEALRLGSSRGGADLNDYKNFKNNN